MSCALDEQLPYHRFQFSKRSTSASWYCPGSRSGNQTGVAPARSAARIGGELDVSPEAVREAIILREILKRHPGKSRAM
jgi:hypothetical protein